MHCFVWSAKRKLKTYLFIYLVIYLFIVYLGLALAPWFIWLLIKLGQSNSDSCSLSFIELSWHEGYLLEYSQSGLITTITFISSGGKQKSPLISQFIRMYTHTVLPIIYTTSSYYVTIKELSWLWYPSSCERTDGVSAEFWEVGKKSRN